MYDVLIIGAGFGGLIAAIELEAAGISSYLIIDKASAPGGVWFTHTYPGAACDIHSDFYSIKQFPNQNWSARFSNQQEILLYLSEVAEKTGIRGKMQLNTLITLLEFDETWGGWCAYDKNNQCWQAHSVILATGPFRLPFTPEIEGIKQFNGAIFHSALWDHTIPINGKRIAVVGTGSSAAQIVPAIAAVAGELTVLQRTPAWVLPKWNKLRPSWNKKLFASIPIFQLLSRSFQYYKLEIIGGLFMKKQPQHALFTRLALRKLEKEVIDPEVRKKLTPAYPLGCKRIVLSDDFYPCFNLPHVKLITEKIETIRTDGIKTTNGFHHVDVIIFATGYTVADLDGYITIRGRKGVCLNELWEKHSPIAYRGIQVAGFPHLCMQLGPNSGVYHTSVLHVITSQMKYWAKFLIWKKKLSCCFVDVRESTQKAYHDSIQRRLKKTIWDGNCEGWFLNRKGINVVHFPGLAAAYRKSMRHVLKEAYEIISTKNKN